MQLSPLVSWLKFAMKASMVRRPSSSFGHPGVPLWPLRVSLTRKAVHRIVVMLAGTTWFARLRAATSMPTTTATGLAKYSCHHRRSTSYTRMLQRGKRRSLIILLVTPESSRIRSSFSSLVGESVEKHVSTLSSMYRMMTLYGIRPVLMSPARLARAGSHMWQG